MNLLKLLIGVVVFFGVLFGARAVKANKEEVI
jgi:hypothetical protein